VKLNTDGTGRATLAYLQNVAGLVLSGETLYGTTRGTGTADYGAVFSVNTDGSGYTSLKAFNGNEAGNPYDRVIVSEGMLYGTTSRGGNNYGTVFRLGTDGSNFQLLHSFNDSDGKFPHAGLTLVGSTLYGTAWDGGDSNMGVVFKVNPDGSGFTVLKSFGAQDGGGPGRLVASGGRLFGAMEQGAVTPLGLLFMMNLDGSGYTVLHHFNGDDGGNPSAPLVVSGDKLYGVTPYGGAVGNRLFEGYGTVFSFSLAPPVITVGPADKTARTGSFADFTVQADGCPVMAYQWFFYSTNALPGATNSDLHLGPLLPTDSGLYTVVITNAFGAVTSAPARLTVGWPAFGDETLYVSDTAANRIEMYDVSTGAYLGVFAGNGLNAPTGLAFDSAGNLYVANSGDNTIAMFTTNGVGSVFASTGLSSPQGLAFNSGGTLYVANPGDGTIIGLFPPGAGIWLYATNMWAHDVAVDAAGQLYANEGGLIWQISGVGFNYHFADCLGSVGLAFDSAGDLYAVSHNILKFNTWGYSSVFATNSVSGAWGLAFDSGDYLYVASRYNGTIERFAPDGTYLGVFASGLSGPRFIAIRAGSPPLIVGCASNITVTASSPSGATVSYTSSAGSGCAGAGITCSPPSGSLFPIGTTAVSCLATDACGQTASCTFTVTVVKPALLAVCSPDITFPATDLNGAQVSYISSTSGGCSGASIACSPASGSIFPIGTTTVSCVATDACGQTASCAFTVKVVKPPLVAICPSNILVAATSPSGATVSYTSSTSGGCSGASITCSPPSGSFFPIGTTTVSCLATDVCGQAASCASSVTVKALGSGGTVTDCTEAALRAAMLGGGVVTFACDGTIRLSSPLSVLTDTVLDGNSHKVTISGNGAVRLVYVSTDVRLTILNLSFTDGVSPNGGALFNAGGSVYATNCVFTGNRATGPDGSSSVPNGITGAGGAVYNAGSFIASQCAFLLNTAQGGRGADGSPDVLPQPPLAGNGAWGEGGAFCNLGVATFERSLFASNSATGGSGGRGSPGDLSSYPQNPMSHATKGGRGGGGAGGALYNLNAVSLVNCTLAHNKGNGGNGGVGGYQISSGSQPWYGPSGGNGGDAIGGVYSTNGLLTMTNCTVASNSAAGGTGGDGGPCSNHQGRGGQGGMAVGGVFVQQFPALLINCIAACNSSIGGPGGYGCYDGDSNATVCGYSPKGIDSNTNFCGSMCDLGHNLSPDPSFTNITSLHYTDPKFGPFADNGGPTLTMALLPGSPAIDSGDTSLAPATDQRGFPRPAGLAADIGAFEYGSVMPTLAVSLSGTNGLNILASGNAGQSCRLFSSPDLANWVPIATNQIEGDGTVIFYDTCAPGSASRFYRLVMP